MKKKNIIKKNQDFQRIIKNNKSIVSKEFIIYLEKNNNSIYHFGISVSKKLGNAVVRNKLKRQVKSIIDKKDYQNTFNCIIILRKGVLKINYWEMQNALFKIIEKLDIVKEDNNEEK